MSKKLNRVGEKYLTNEGYEIEIIEYFDANRCTVRFLNGSVLKNIEFNNIKTGRVKNLLALTMYNVGYFGVGIYKSCLDSKKTKAYTTWTGMFGRCYNKIFSKKYKTYLDCTVDERWHNFQNFAKWHEENYNFEIMQGWQLDKDILIKGNKGYSSETCCFVPSEINSLFVKCNNSRGEYPVGVHLDKPANLYVAQLKRYKKVRYLGYFKTPEEAFQAYKVAKEAHIKEVADRWKSQIAENVYEALYNYNIEITD